MVEAEDVRTVGPAGEEPNPVFVLDDDWRFTYVNEEAEGIFETGRRKLEGQTFWSQIPDTMETNFRDPFRRALKQGEPAEFEARCPVTRRWYRFQAYPFEEGLSVHAHDIDEKVDREQELRLRERSLRAAYEIVADREAAPAEKIERLLAVIRETLGTEFATLSRVEPDEDTYRFQAVASQQPGQLPEDEGVPLGELPNCAEVVRTEHTLVLQDVEEQAPDLADPTWGVSAYLGAPVWVEDELHGTFCFYSTERRSGSFTDWEVTYVEMFADWVGKELERIDGIEVG